MHQMRTTQQQQPSARHAKTAPCVFLVPTAALLLLLNLDKDNKKQQQQQRERETRRRWKRIDGWQNPTGVKESSSSSGSSSGRSAALSPACASRSMEVEGTSAAGRKTGVMDMMLCGKEEKVLGVQKAPGSCPYCGGGVAATDVEAKWVLCFLPLCLKTKRRFSCTACSRRLVTYPAILHD